MVVGRYVRKLLALSLMCGAVAGLPAHAEQDPIELVVPFAPGGASTALGRLNAQALGEQLDTVVVVSNRPGAGGSIGAGYVANATADGRTMLLGTISTHAINPALYKKLAYDANKDFTPVARIAGLPNVLVVRADSDIKTVEDFVAKAKQQRMSFGSPGNGTTAHLAGELMKMMQPDMQVVHVPYRGTAAATTDLLGGRIDFQFDNVSSLIPHIQSGRLRALAVSSMEPVDVLPGVAPLSEHSGFDKFEVLSWFGFWLPKGASQEQVQTYTKALDAMYADEAFLDKIRAIGFTPTLAKDQTFLDFVSAEQQKWREVVEAANIQID